MVPAHTLTQWLSGPLCLLSLALSLSLLCLKHSEGRLNKTSISHSAESGCLPLLLLLPLLLEQLATTNLHFLNNWGPPLLFISSSSTSPFYFTYLRLTFFFFLNFHCFHLYFLFLHFFLLLLSDLPLLSPLFSTPPFLPISHPLPLLLFPQMLLFHFPSFLLLS